MAIPVYVRPIGLGEYRVRVDLSGLPVGQRAAVAAALEQKGFAPGATAQDLSHVSRVYEGEEDAARGVGHAAAQYLRAVIATYGTDWIDALAELQEESPAAETAEESPTEDPDEDEAEDEAEDEYAEESPTEDPDEDEDEDEAEDEYAEESPTEDPDEDEDEDEDF